MIRRQASTWFAAALVPPIALAGWLAWTRPPAELPPREEVPRASRDPGLLAALEGELELGDGTRLHVLLHPMHADPVRQAFERQALAKRLSLPDGAPWSVSIERTAAAAGRTPRPLEVRAPSVVDGSGTCLRALPPPATSTDRKPDPLRTLLAGLEGDLPPATVRRGVLWGRAPLAPGRLVLEREIELRACTVAAARSESAMVRVGAVAGGGAR